MTKKEIEKVVDELIVRLPIGKEFPLAYELSMYFNSILSDIDLNKDKTHIIEDVTDFMVECEYIKHRPTEINEILEPKGIDAKKAGGHFKYLESLKPKKKYWLTKYQMLYLPLFILFGFWNLYNQYYKNELKREYDIQGQKLDSLNVEFEKNLSLLDSLIIENELLKKEMIDDSLQAKNASE